MSVETGGLGGKAVRGASVTMVGQILRILLMLVSTIILSRLFAPEDFGLLTIVMAVVTLGELLRDFGLSTAAARSVNISQAQKSNLFWINITLGVLFAVVTALCARFLAEVFDSPPIEYLLYSLSSVFILSGAAAQFRAELNRNLRFTSLTLADTAPILLGLISAVMYANWITADYWALAVQQIVVALSGLIISVALSRWIPGLPNRASVREFTSFGVGLFGTQFVAYFTKNSDSLALGYFWGPAVTGIYGRAYQLLMVPINQILAPLTRVAVPILTRVGNNAELFLKYVTAAHKLMSIALAVIFGLLIGLAYPAVDIVFGAKWLTMVPIFQALAVGGVFRGMNQIAFWVFLAKGETAKQFRFYLWSQPVIVIIMLAGLPWGALGVAVGHSLGYALNWVISLMWCSKATSTRLCPLLGSGIQILMLFMLPAVAIGLCSVWASNSTWTAIVLGLSLESIYLVLIFSISKRFRALVASVWVPLSRVRRPGGV